MTKTRPLKKGKKLIIQIMAFMPMEWIGMDQNVREINEKRRERGVT